MAWLYSLSRTLTPGLVIRSYIRNEGDVETFLEVQTDSNQSENPKLQVMPDLTFTYVTFRVW